MGQEAQPFTQSGSNYLNSIPANTSLALTLCTSAVLAETRNGVCQQVAHNLAGQPGQALQG